MKNIIEKLILLLLCSVAGFAQQDRPTRLFPYDPLTPGCNTIGPMWSNWVNGKLWQCVDPTGTQSGTWRLVSQATTNFALLLNQNNVATGLTTVDAQSDTLEPLTGDDMGFAVGRHTSANFSPMENRTVGWFENTFTGTSGTAWGLASILHIPNLTTSQGSASLLGYVFKGVDGVPGGSNDESIGVHGECHNNGIGVCIGLNSEVGQFASAAGLLIGIVSNAGLASGTGSSGTQHVIYGEQILMNYPAGGTNLGAGLLIRPLAGIHKTGLQIEECGSLNCGVGVTGTFNHLLDLVSYQSTQNILGLTNNNANVNTGFTNEIRFGRAANGPADSAHLQSKILSDISTNSDYSSGHLSIYTSNSSTLQLAIDFDANQNSVFGGQAVTKTYTVASPPPIPLAGGIIYFSNAKNFVDDSVAVGSVAIAGGHGAHAGFLNGSWRILD